MLFRSIGARLFIDHGMVVIGETSEIGDDVTLYQNVTLGGTDPFTGRPGKRHPTLEDGVILGAGAQVLGPITVGEGARIGANAVVLRSFLEDTTIAGVPTSAVGRCDPASDTAAEGTVAVADGFRRPRASEAGVLACRAGRRCLEHGVEDVS